MVHAHGSLHQHTVTLLPPLDKDAFAVQSVAVSKIQVCLLSVAHTLKDELNTLGMTASTGSTQGLHLLLQETVLALLRNPDYWVYASTSSQSLLSACKAEKAFGSMVLDQRSCVQQETLVNLGGTGIKMVQLKEGSDNAADLLVVTLLVAAEGE